MKKVLLIIIVVLSVFMTSISVLAADTTENPQLISAQQYNYQDTSGCWFEDAVAKYGFPDIFATSGQMFYPSNEITRMEYVQMLHKALNIEINYFAAPDISDYYNDVDNGDIGTNELNDLVVTGIIDKKTSFGPNGQLNRDEMVHYTINALNYITGGDYAMIEIMPVPFADDSKINSAYKNDIIKAVILKIINGRGNNMFYPDQGATRAEAVTVVDRLVTLAAALKSDVEVNATATETKNGLQMTLSITNNSNSTVTINHSSGQKYDFDLLDAHGETLYCWSADKMFPMMVTSTQIASGKSIEFTELLDNTTYQPLKAQIGAVKAYIIGTSTNFNINPDGYTAN